MFLVIDKATQSVGENVTGTVHLNSSQHWPNGDKLWIIIAGKEKAKWVDIERKHHRHGDHVTVEVIEHEREQCDVFMEDKSLVFDFSGGIPVGQWSFPFSVEVPKWAPSSFYFVPRKQAKMKVSYKMKAEVVGNNGETIETKRRLVVRRPPFETATGQHLNST